jgi:hypothetical protein
VEIPGGVEQRESTRVRGRIEEGEVTHRLEELGQNLIRQENVYSAGFDVNNEQPGIGSAVAGGTLRITA